MSAASVNRNFAWKCVPARRFHAVKVVCLSLTAKMHFLRSLFVELRAKKRDPSNIDFRAGAGGLHSALN